MKRTIKFSVAIIFILALSLFVYNRFKTKRLEHFIGNNRSEIENYLSYNPKRFSSEEVTLNKADERIKIIIESKNLNSTKPLLKYTLRGEVRKLEFWLIDEGEGYYVIEAIATN